MVALLQVFTKPLAMDKLKKFLVARALLSDAAVP